MVKNTFWGAASGLLIVLLGCHNIARVAAPAGDSAVVAVAPVYGAAKDTVARVTTDSSEEGGEDELRGFYAEEIASYTKKCMIDSAFRLGMDHYRLYLKDSCLMDSAIVLPKEYVNTYKLDSFVTHTFISKVRLERNGKTILDRVITKEDFTPLLDASLRQYATVRCPNITLKRDSVLIGYSISIPLTDVGQLKYAVIDGSGNLTFRDAGPND